MVDRLIILFSKFAIISMDYFYNKKSCRVFYRFCCCLKKLLLFSLRRMSHLWILLSSPFLLLCFHNLSPQSVIPRVVHLLSLVQYMCSLLYSFFVHAFVILALKQFRVCQSHPLFHKYVCSFMLSPLPPIKLKRLTAPDLKGLKSPLREPCMINTAIRVGPQQEKGRDGCCLKVSEKGFSVYIDAGCLW